MTRYIGVLLLAALALWTGEARGECAWVLWKETSYMATGYTVIEAMESEKTCRVRKAEVERGPRPTNLDKNAELRYLCPPDTIDPRAPKGAQ